jgi:signal transduction histidine kinase
MILLGESGPATKPTHLLYIGALLASNLIMPRIPYRNPQTFGSCLLAIDTVLVLVGVVLCDSASQDLLIAYFLCIIVATFADSQRRIALAAALVTGVYSFWLFPHFHAFDHAALLIRLPFLFIVTVFYGYMILRIRDEHARRLEAEDRLLGADCLLRATRLFSSSLVSSEILEQVSSIIRSAVRVDRCEFRLIPRNVAALPKTASATIERIETANAAETGRSAAEIALPIVHDDEPFGTLILEDACADRTFSPAEIAFCEVISNAAAAALKNAQQYEALCELERGRTEFLANFSHELRTPLNVILGFSEMLGEELAERGTDDARDMTSRIYANAVRLSKHVENLIDLSVTTFGRDVATIGRVDLASMLHRLASSAADEGRARVALEMSPEVGAIFTDGRKLERVVGNLLSNAVKFTDAGSVTLRAKLVHNRDEGEPAAPTDAKAWERVLSLSVTDTGVGIDPADITRVLRGFHQASQGPGRRYGGLGIGLDVARKLARSLGGQIHVKSTPRQGSEFEVLVPVLLAA